MSDLKEYRKSLWKYGKKGYLMMSLVFFFVFLPLFVWSRKAGNFGTTILVMASFMFVGNGVFFYYYNKEKSSRDLK